MKTIPLTRGLLALVDDSDFEALSHFRWHAIGNRSRYTNYAAANSHDPKPLRRTILMHRQIMNPPDGMVVDHIDGNGLNNQRSNLRILTQSQNLGRASLCAANTSGFKGVTFDRQTGRWKASIQSNGKMINIGRFDDIAEAARARDEMAIKIYGEYAYKNIHIDCGKA